MTRETASLRDGAWKESSYRGEAVDFSAVAAGDDYLHLPAPDAHFTAIETNLYGFNIPEADIHCNIYVLWHHALNTMSVHIFVYRGARILAHQLEADYFLEHLYLPAVRDNADWTVQMGGCRVRMKVVRPLEEVHMWFDDPARGFALDLNCTGAMPPVGRPGGKHFTQLMKTSGQVTLDGEAYVINGFYMRDRSWGYNRPEQAERTPPYRWMTGWFGDDCGFVVAWLDTGMLEGREFGPHWNEVVAGPEASGANKWESGGKTPSLNLRSGWIARAGRPVPVVRMDVRTLFAEGSRLLVKGIELEIEDAQGSVHRITGTTRSMIPKMYWQNLLVYMHFMSLEYDGRRGDGDLMDSYATHHIRSFGL
ncbi:hypothetical protein GCM10010909_01660 [Acidocella aquatica]|uniref:Hydroxyneurosporene synthase n=1 Tax=Acidocella aquatica TaxID=1922313 RepID=A0ABQ6A261_9PROT|nr:hypothetical protein [Acidocella aquatica]GLR65488.1 hypothetical protein GCM10010909_01660 [Acidocella aquatica]